MLTPRVHGTAVRCDARPGDVGPPPPRGGRQRRPAGRRVRLLGAAPRLPVLQARLSRCARAGGRERAHAAGLRGSLAPRTVAPALGAPSSGRRPCAVGRALQLGGRGLRWAGASRQRLPVTHGASGARRDGRAHRGCRRRQGAHERAPRACPALSTDRRIDTRCESAHTGCTPSPGPPNLPLRRQTATWRRTAAVRRGAAVAEPVR